MIDHRNPAALRSAARLALETRLTTGRPYRATESRGLGLIVAIGIVCGGILPLINAFLRPFVTIAAEMAGLAPVALLLLTLLVLLSARRRRSSRSLIRSATLR